MSDVIMTTKQLMDAADRLSGVTTAMTSAEIQDKFAALSAERMFVTYLLDKMRGTHDSSIRAEIKRSLSILGARQPHLKGMINQGLAGERIVYKQSVEPKPKKRKFE